MIDEYKMHKDKKREKTYVQDCFCGFCYTCGCFYNSYLNSPSRRFWHNARYYCSELVEHKLFEAIILFLITFSSITLVSNVFNACKIHTHTIVYIICKCTNMHACKLIS